MAPVRSCSVVMATAAAAGCGPAPFDRAAEQQKLLLRDAEWAELRERA